MRFGAAFAVATIAALLSWPAFAANEATATGTEAAQPQQQALSQGALLTREDLAYRVFFVSTRTVSRDLLALRQADPKTPLPLRSNVHDIGPVLTHRTQIVRLALQGKTTSQICQIMKPSFERPLFLT